MEYLRGVKVINETDRATVVSFCRHTGEKILQIAVAPRPGRGQWSGLPDGEFITAVSREDIVSDAPEGVRVEWDWQPLLFPESIPLVVGVRPEDGEIGTVGPYRHTVRWTEDAGRESSCTYCNNCGSPFANGGRLKPHIDPLQREARGCASCHCFQGFVASATSGEIVNENDRSSPAGHQG